MSGIVTDTESSGVNGVIKQDPEITGIIKKELSDTESSPSSREPSTDGTGGGGGGNNDEEDDQQQQKKKRKAQRKETQLTEEEKKLHHIKSEHKRRAHIRSTFDKLVELVPELSPNESRSELTVLTKSTNYIRNLREENSKLIKLALDRGIEIPDSLK